MSAPFTPEQEARIAEIAVHMLLKVETQRRATELQRIADDLHTDAEWALKLEERRDA